MATPSADAPANDRAPHGTGAGQGAGPARRPARPRVRRGEPVSAAMRRIISFYFRKLRRLEAAGGHVGEDAIHEMRVTTRRLRAALRIARPFFRRKLLRPIQQQLRDTAQALGAVRDRDVIAAHVRSYSDRDPAAREKLASWIDELQTQRAQAHQALLDRLAGKHPRKLRRDFQAFLAATAPGAAAASPAANREEPCTAAPMRVCDVVPVAIWAQYCRIRTYETVREPTVESLHALRIEIKRLRYLLEFFQSCLGAGAQSAIDLTVRAQDHLGQLHDAHVAAGFVRSHIAAATALAPASDLAGMATSLAAAESEVAQLRAAFPPIWQQLTRPRFRRELALLLGRL